MGYSWVAVEMRTGLLICELPDLVCEKIGATLCDYYAPPSVTLPIPVSPAPPMEWERAVLAGASCFVLLDDDQSDPVWGGWLTNAPRKASATIALSVPSWEAYFSRRFVPDATYTGMEQCQLLASLVAASLDATVPLIVEYTPGATTRDRQYTADSDKTLLSAMQELSGVLGGPEWTIVWRHLTAPERYVPVLKIADRIGTGAAPGLGANASFEMPGPVHEFAYSPGDWSEGSGANVVTATSTSDGDVRPQSTPQVYADPDRPTVEYRWSPSSSISEIATLNSHAASALAILKTGARSISLSAVRSEAPVLGLDWRLGDDVGYRIQHPSIPSGMVYGVGRCIAWEAGISGVQTVTPILATQGVGA